MQLVVNEETVIRLRDMSEEDFYEFCALNEDHRIERTASGDILIMAPAGGDTGDRNAELTMQLRAWSKKEGRGQAFASSTGFTLPNGAIRSPDAAWVDRSRLANLSREQRRRFLPLCPDFVVELTSPTDPLSKVQEKMREWMANGAQFGWLLDPDGRQAHVYPPDGSVEIVAEPAQLAGEGPVAGFVLDLKDFWDLNW